MRTSVYGIGFGWCEGVDKAREKRHLRGMGKIRKSLWVPLVVVLVAVAFFVLLLGMGRLFPFQANPSSDVVQAVEKAADLDQYLAESEAKVFALKRTLAKEIIWADPVSRAKTPISIIYIHGFSASRGETAPLMESVARRLGANLFYTRLKAHGLKDGEGFAQVKAQDWIDDAREALAIGRRLGERVAIVGMSTGAILALHLGVENKNAKDLVSLVLLSPNHRPADWRAGLFAGPFGKTLARVLIGEHSGFIPQNEEHAYYWTARYRSEAIPALMDLVNHGSRLDLSVLQVPVLTLYTTKDTVVDVAAIESRHKEIGSEVTRIVDLPLADRHELVGKFLAPQALHPAAEEIQRFIEFASAQSF